MWVKMATGVDSTLWSEKRGKKQSEAAEGNDRQSEPVG